MGLLLLPRLISAVRITFWLPDDGKVTRPMDEEVTSVLMVADDVPLVNDQVIRKSLV